MPCPAVVFCDVLVACMRNTHVQHPMSSYMLLALCHAPVRVASQLYMLACVA